MFLLIFYNLFFVLFPLVSIMSHTFSGTMSLVRVLLLIKHRYKIPVILSSKESASFIYQLHMYVYSSQIFTKYKRRENESQIYLHNYLSCQFCKH